jgi:phage FluMu gp28-like protein
VISATSLINRAMNLRLRRQEKRGAPTAAASPRLLRAATAEYRERQEQVFGLAREAADQIIEQAVTLPADLPPAFVEWLRGCFLPYQLRWIVDGTDFGLALKGRQLGYTDATAARCLVRAYLLRRPQIVLSAAQRNADELLEAVRKHAEFIAAIGMPEVGQLWPDKASEVGWRRRGSVTALASNPRTARSFHGDVYLDEFAYHADPEAIWRASAPMATRGDWGLRVISTPAGAQGPFYDLCSDPPDGWSFHRVSLDDAEREGLRVDRSKLLKLVGGDERAFAEAYLLEFLDANLQFIPTAMADRALHWEGSLPDLTGAEIYAGLDVGRTQDLTALLIVAVVGQVAWVLAVLTCKRTAFKAQKRMIRDARATFAWHTLHVDETGLGKQLAEELEEDFGSEVVRVTFTNDTKADMATRTLRWLRDTRVRFPKGAPGKALHAETIAVRRKITGSGNVVYEVPRTAKGHGDRFWALALALKGAGEPMPPRELGVEPVLAVA